MARRSRVRESQSEIADMIKAAIVEQEQSELKAEVSKTLGEMKTFAESISPVYEGRPRPGSPPGRYKESFETEEFERDDGLPGGVLRNTDPIANLVEYGSIHNPEHAVLARTAEAFGGSHHEGEE